MIKHTPDLPDPAISETTQSMQQSNNEYANFINAPFRKLDADEYMANDIDGVTESLLGSGNLNFLMMQAGQTDESLSAANPFDLQGGGDSFASASMLNALSTSSGPAAAYNDIATDRGFEMPNSLGDGAELGSKSSPNATVGSLGASTLAAKSSALNPLSDSGNFSDSYASSLSNTGTNGNNGKNGVDGEGVGNTTIINNNTTNIDNSVIDLGDVNNFIDETILENIENITNNITNNTTDFLTEVVNNVFDTTNNLINNIFNGGNPLDIGPIGISLDATLDDFTNLTLDIINGDTITNVLDNIIDLAPVLNPVSDLVGDIFANVSLDAILDPFQYDNSLNDFDLHLGTDLELLGISLPDLALDVPLDPVEMLLGDIDIGLDVTENLLALPTDLLGDVFGNGPADTDLELAGLENILDTALVSNVVETLVNPVEDLVGDIDIGAGLGLDILGLGNADDTGADTDISIPLDIDFIDSDLLHDGIEIGLDPVEAIIGDVDIDLGVAANLLGDVAGPMFDEQAGGLDFETPLSDLGDDLSDPADFLLPLADSDLTGGELNFDDDGLLGGIEEILDTALDLVNALPENNGGLDLGALTSGIGDTLGDVTSGWTESILPDAGNLLGDGLLSDPSSLLPDPVSFAPILAIPVIPVLPIAPLGGGLFG